jgi:hypothetical protein
MHATDTAKRMPHYKLSWCGSASPTCPNGVTTGVWFREAVPEGTRQTLPYLVPWGFSPCKTITLRSTHTCTMAKMGTFNRLPLISTHFSFELLITCKTEVKATTFTTENIAVKCSQGVESIKAVVVDTKHPMLWYKSPVLRLHCRREKRFLVAVRMACSTHRRNKELYFKPLREETV